MTACNYCKKEIDQETYGWGYMTIEDKDIDFHNECLQIFEGVKVA